MISTNPMPSEHLLSVVERWFMTWIMLSHVLLHHSRGLWRKALQMEHLILNFEDLCGDKEGVWDLYVVNILANDEKLHSRFYSNLNTIVILIVDTGQRYAALGQRFNGYTNQKALQPRKGRVMKGSSSTAWSCFIYNIQCMFDSLLAPYFLCHSKIHVKSLVLCLNLADEFRYLQNYRQTLAVFLATKILIKIGSLSWI